MKNILCNERGFLLLNVVLLTLITAFAAMILLEAAPRIRNPQATLRLTASHLANEQFAYLESRAAAGTEIIGNHSFLGHKEDLRSINLSEKNPIDFKVTATVTANGNLRRASVKVIWQVGGENFDVTTEKTILFVKSL